MRLQSGKCSQCLGVLALLAWCGPGFAQTFVYVEPDNSKCPVITAPPAATPKKVDVGVSVAGALKVSCGFTEGSYTVILSSTDPNATLAPKTFLVNFGRLSGTGAFTAKFATTGEQTIFATITSNMGSPVLRGGFTSSTNVVDVVRR
jgi:hypothetical protein